MKAWWICLASILSASLHCKGLVVIDDIDPGQCDQTNHGTQVLVLNRENNELILICSKNDGQYQWKTPGGDDPIGEIFSPGYDCSKILDSYPDAKDGMYWINLGGYYPKQVYCDMTTDGGGYILVGRKNNSKTWTLPSNDFPVEPYGDPHWSSNLGDAPIVDFRVQIATTEDFQDTKADWSFRLKSERPLKELMVDDDGCSPDEPGIGNIAYVKDLQTETIVSTEYSCSVFGKYQHPLTGFGWHQMNSCLNKPCKSGYAYWDHPTGITFQVDFHGSFSFSASGGHSGVTHDATAFVGCSQNQVCCGCFGPVGGTDDYCGHNCTAKNGGTVKKQTYTWFWVRASLPKRVWNRCMEYKVKIESGEMVSYRLLDGDTTPEKGSCPKDDALLNEGIVVVPDGETAKKVPAVPGLLEYRKDNKELYVRANDTWKVIAPENKILEETSDMVSPKLEDIKQKLYNQNQTVRQEILAVDSQLKEIDQKLHVQNQTAHQNNLELHSELKTVKEMLNEQNQTFHQKNLEVHSELENVKELLYKQNQTLLLKITELEQKFNASHGIKSCKELKSQKPGLTNGEYLIGSLGTYYCDMSNGGWTLIARFSNSDSKNWISNGNFWYDRNVDFGNVTNPAENSDMISEAFWRVKGEKFKITRSDDSSHTALLQTTSNCLQGETFRSKITSYGNFRNGAVWASNNYQCLGSCQVSYGGQYTSTAGFEQYSCSSDIQSSNYIGLWCNWGSGDAAVMMIGGGGSGCDRADHGIGITEADSPKFGGSYSQDDFGYNENNTPSSYSLNLWVR